MIRAALFVVLGATAAFADGQTDYTSALQAAQIRFQAQVDAYDQGTAPILAPTEGDGYFSDKGEAIAVQADTRRAVFPNLIAVEDVTTNLCIWGFDTDIYPMLPRTDALALQAHAQANNWPVESLAPLPVETTTYDCWERVMLALELGDTDQIAITAIGRYTVFVGIPEAPQS